MHPDELLTRSTPALSAWSEAFSGALAALTERGEARVPCVRGVTWIETSRWLYRASLEASPDRWWPCVYWDVRHAPSQNTWWEQARGGWLCTNAQPEDIPAGLREESCAGRICVVRVEGDAPLGEEWARQVRDMEGCHVAAVDPDLALTRARVLAQCDAGAVVYLSGELGVGKRTLSRWAYARSRQSSRRWRFMHDLDTLSDEELAGLEDELGRRTARPRPFLTRARSGSPRPDAPGLEAIEGSSPELVETLRALVKLAPSGLGVLVTGEPGTGKELIARALHEASGREGAFVALDMGALSEGLAESTLFGHVKGAFTGAHAGRAGAFRAAHGGTLFLDEVGNLSPPLQAKLLRALQERAVTPVGADASVQVDVRVVSATNADLDAMTRRGTFRPDLLSRLRVARLHAAPLRERMEDLDALARALLGEGGAGDWCTRAARRALESHDWPGNVRELKNTLEVARVLAEDAAIDLEHLGELGARRAPGVLCVTRSCAPHEGPPRVGPRTLQMLQVQELRVPPVRERSRRARAALVAELLRGRPCAPVAWRALMRHAWWGNLFELHELARTLEALPPGALTREVLGRAAPQLLGDQAIEPTLVMLGPMRTRDTVSGLTWRASSGAIVIGRVSGEAELRESARSGDARAARALEFLDARARGVRADYVALPFLPRLSRLSALITRRGDGLVARAFPGLGLAAEAMALGAQEWTPLDEEATPLGRAGALRFSSKQSGETYVQAFVFEGEGALRDHGDDALELHERARDALGTMLGTATESAPRPPKKTRRRLFAWRLSTPECEALTDVVDSFEGGSIGQHITRCLGDMEGDEAGSARLRRYLRSAPRASQYVSRLYEHEANDELRGMLKARALARGEDAQRWLDELPSGVQRSIDE